jgi:hypothetical protein
MMSQNAAIEKMRDLAQQLLSREASARNAAEQNNMALGLLEALRRRLSELTGANGFHALMSRALTLARVQAADLSAVELRPDGSLNGLGEICGRDPAAGIELIAQLLGLLVIFVGESLTLRIVLDAGVHSAVPNAETSGGSEHDPPK